MKYSEIMVRYGELSTKGRNRKSFIDRLGNNVRNVLNDYNVEVKANHDRMHIILHDEDAKEIMNKLSNIFGIENYSPVVKVNLNIDDLKKVVLNLFKEIYHSKISFKVDTKRSNHNFEYDTYDLNKLIGETLLNNFDDVCVKMKNPDVTLALDVRNDGIYVSLNKYTGAWGLPVGTSGKALMMISGGIDSPVAAYLAMKRGVKVEMIHFYSPPYTSELALNKTKDLVVKLTKYCGPITFIEVPFTKIQEEIKNKVPSGYLMTIQRRAMLRIADIIAHKRKDLAIFTGESLGQVASQTLESMVAINDVTKLPVLRPLISMDKNEIIAIAKNIDTYDLSILPYEDCCTIFTPPSPKTKPNLLKSREFEKLVDFDKLCEEAVNNIKLTKISNNDKYIDNKINEFNSLL